MKPQENTLDPAAFTGFGTIKSETAITASSSVRFTILGTLASMKNRRIPTKHNPRVTVPNKACSVFKRDFMNQVPRKACRALGSLRKPLRTSITVYYPSMRSDLDCALVYDLLQEAGVIRNDRYIREKTEIARIDKHNTRVEIEVSEIDSRSVVISVCERHGHHMFATDEDEKCSGCGKYFSGRREID